MPEISILTAVRADDENKARWLTERAWASIQKQTFKDWEWVVVNDDSPVSVHMPEHERIIYVRASKQQGPAMCRNTAARLATGRALIVLDADDEFEDERALETLHEVWSRDEAAFVYGDMLVVQPAMQKVIKFPPYDFVKTLDPKGLVPVTGLMSVGCWRDAGGWKSEFGAGLEDVEFWIAAGAAGHCGVKVDNLVVFRYNKHPKSRTAAMRAAQQEQVMRAKIRAMHSDLYEGRYPVGCCGGSRRGVVPRPLGPTGPAVTRLEGDLVAGGMVWVQYTGKAMGQFGIKAAVSGVAPYQVKGRGSKMQVWAVDAPFILAQGRGRHFSLTTPPVPETEKVEPPPVEEPTFEAPEPELAEILALPPTRRPSPPQRPDTKEEQPKPLEDLEEAVDLGPAQNLDSILRMLEAEGWTLPKLTEADPRELTPYPGIGLATANKLVAGAKELWVD